MTKKDLFKIILKLYGLYSIINLIVQTPNLVYYFYFDTLGDMNWLILTVPILSLLVIYLLLFKPQIIINLFKLDRGFENNEFSIDSKKVSNLTKVALTIIAIYLIVSNLGEFLTQVVFSFKESISSNSLDRLIKTIDYNPVNYKIMFNTGLSLIFGFLILTNNTRITNWIEKLNKKNSL